MDNDATQLDEEAALEQQVMTDDEASGLGDMAVCLLVFMQHVTCHSAWIEA